ncbi:hypothetical protein FRC12_007952 [Ceratobasidium sp. 428]|nr:hypothetical protein FRC12_007952 [Ceratobasidium sp. 428]
MESVKWARLGGIGRASSSSIKEMNSGEIGPFNEAVVEWEIDCTASRGLEAGETGVSMGKMVACCLRGTETGAGAAHAKQASRQNRSLKVVDAYGLDVEDPLEARQLGNALSLPTQAKPLVAAQTVVVVGSIRLAMLALVLKGVLHALQVLGLTRRGPDILRSIGLVAAG